MTDGPEMSKIYQAMNIENIKMNPFQGPSKKVLCVCSVGLLRSPTAAWVLSNRPWNFNTRSCGIEPGFALIEIDENLLTWADEIVCMSNRQQMVILDLMEEFNIKGTPVHVLDVPDNFGFRESKLVRIFRETFKKLFPVN